MFFSLIPWRRKSVGVFGPAAAAGPGSAGPIVKPATQPELATDDQDPLFEGGGGVLTPRPYWEKAGWGVAVLLAVFAGSGVAAAAEDVRPGNLSLSTSRVP